MTMQDELYAQQQAYNPVAMSQLSDLAKAVRAKNDQRAESRTIPVLPALSQGVNALDNMIGNRNKRIEDAQLLAKKSMQDKILADRDNAAGLGLGGMATTVLNGTSGPGTRNQVKNVTLYSNDPKSASIEKMARENLKYSQGRGKGCTDCSAATQRIMKETYGINIGGNTESQWKNGVSISPGSQRQGDMVFFKDPKKKNRNVTHVAFNNGDGTFTDFGTGGLRTRPFKGYSLPVVGFRRYV
jgi:cell wall-associated NlpC family hydrolase